jgi:hypothetical protein
MVYIWRLWLFVEPDRQLVALAAPGVARDHVAIISGSLKARGLLYLHELSKPVQLLTTSHRQLAATVRSV